MSQAQIILKVLLHCFIYKCNEDNISLRDNNTRVALRRNFEPSKKLLDAKKF